MADTNKTKKNSDFEEYIRMQSDKIAQVLPEGIDPKKYIDKITQILCTDKDFLSGNFSSKSFINGLIKCALGGLYPNTAEKEAYLTVGKDGNVKFMLGLGGHLKWATKTGLLVRHGVIRENDHVTASRTIDKVDFFLEEKIVGRGEIVAYYATYRNTKHPDEDRDFIILSKEEIQEHQKESASNSLIWKNHFDAMAENYCIKKLLKHHQYNLYDDDSDNAERATSVLNSDDFIDAQNTAVLNEYGINQDDIEEKPIVEEEQPVAKKKRGRKPKNPSKELESESEPEPSPEIPTIEPCDLTPLDFDEFNDESDDFADDEVPF